MTVIADTSALVAFYSESGTQHDDVSAWLEAHGEVMVVSPYVVAELDYLVATRKGVDAELAVLAELAGGAYELAAMSAADIALAAEVIARYRDLGIGTHTKFWCATVLSEPNSANGFLHIYSASMPAIFLQNMPRKL